MPRLSARRAFRGISGVSDLAHNRIVIDDNGEEDWDEGIIEEMEEIHELVSEKRYLMDRTLSAGRHEGDTLYHLIYDYPESAFLTMFRMHRNAFWKIVELLTPYWKKTERTYRGGRINIRLCQQRGSWHETN